MSNYGQTALSIVGFFVGAAFGYPQLGFVLGSLAGQALFPTQLPGVQGPRLQDTRTTTAQVGAPVMEVFGTDAVPGVVMYTGPVIEVANTEEVGGKGGPEQDVTTYSYFQTIALGLCRGPMGGIKQIFENGKLVYDRSPQREDENILEFANRIAATDAYESKFTLYLGDEEQLPDPTLESEIGVGEVPGFRGLMYLVFHERELKQEQGLRHPNFKVIVFDQGALTCEPITDYSTDVMFAWNGVEDPDPRSCLNDHSYRYNLSGGGTIHTTLAAALSEAESAEGRSLNSDVSALGYSASTTGPPAPSVIPYGSKPDSAFKHILFNDIVPSALLGVVPPLAGIGTGYRDVCGTMSVNGIGVGQIAWWAGRNVGYPNAESESADYAQSGLNMPSRYCGGTSYTPPQPDANWVLHANGCVAIATCSGNGAAVWHLNDVRIRVTRVTRAPDHPCTPRCGLQPPDFSGSPLYCVVNGRILSKDGEWVENPLSFRVLRASFVGTNSSNALLPVLIARPSDHADFNDQEFWEEAYAGAVEAGLMPAGMTYSPGVPGSATTYPSQVDSGFQLDYSACTLETGGVSLADIITRICARVAPPDGFEIDVSDLTDVFVTGYVVSRVMDARSAIEPLRLVGYFDYVESGRTLKFVTRGKASVRTLEADDLGVHEYGEESPPAVNTRKMQDVDLPRQIRIHYRDPGRDYEESEQLSPARLTTLAVNDVDIECPIAISATQALQAAEVNWSSAWAGRWIEQFTIDITQIELEPADCVLVPIDGRLERVRIVGVDGPPLLRKVEGVRDDADGYVSVAIAEPPVRPPASIVVYSPTTLLLLDLPALREEDDDAGIYAAARPSDDTMSWSGVRIYHSSDGGTTFVNEVTVTNAATIGTLVEALPAGDWHTWDDSVEIVVELVSGSLESRTEADVLAGANALAIRATPQEWVIVQFTTATQESPTQWRLSHLLHGRRGTEYLLGLAGEGADVVLVSGLGIVRLPITNAQIDVEQVYKAVTINTTYATGVDQDFTPHGVALRPFSPVSIEASRQITSGDCIISWVRRDRIGQELQSATPLPMSEDVLEFEVDIYDDSSPPTVIRTLTVTEDTQVVYTAEDQDEDFGSPLPPSYNVRVYQISAVVGRGTPGVATV